MTHHNLIEITRVNVAPTHDSVTRWCTICGAVVIDDDVDGRTIQKGRMIGPAKGKSCDE